ncbi:hypothetical protein ACTFJG_24440 [Klebsiella electrica]|uniref:hypothetical protein n=1 Tax=Klebsiella electrica TaxID=1259973 RepID=UPI00114FADEF|nr:hypothetical protein [Klebsiella electrica]WIO43679.1 hypothetical protein P2G42_03165 [Klebsiella electrica]
MNSLPNQKIVFHQPDSCRHCQSDYVSDVKVMTIEKNLSYGWKIHGKGALHVECSCPMCGMMYTAAETMIPIECDSYLCPSCNDAANLEYKVCKIERDENDFTFEAEISCKKCHKTNKFRHALKRLLNIKKLEIKTTGVSIERFNE